MKITDTFDKALAFAVHLHRHQFRKGGELPYIGHLLGVCGIALENGADEGEAIAALLHDSIEDQAEGFGGADKLREHIRAEFGEKALAIVEGCTDAETIPKPPWRERKERYVAHLADASPSVLLVSASDKLYNARAILQDFREVEDAVWTRFTGGKEGTLWYYRALSDAFQAHGSTPLRRELGSAPCMIWKRLPPGCRERDAPLALTTSIRVDGFFGRRSTPGSTALARLHGDDPAL